MLTRSRKLARGAALRIACTASTNGRNANSPGLNSPVSESIRRHNQFRDPAPTNGDPTALSCSFAALVALIIDTGCTCKEAGSAQGGWGWARLGVCGHTANAAPPACTLNTTACHSLVIAAQAASWKKLRAAGVMACANKYCTHTNSWPWMVTMQSVVRWLGCIPSPRACSSSAKTK